MDFMIREHERQDRAVIRIACEQLEKAIESANDGEVSKADVVHDIRRRCKRIRGLMRLIRPEFDELYIDVEQKLSNAAQQFAAIRDQDVRVDTLKYLLAESKSELADEENALLDMIKSERRELYEHCDIEDRLYQFTRQAEALCRQIGDWRLSDQIDFATGIGRTYKKARMSFERAYSNPTDNTFHLLRKRTKYHCYQIRLISPCWADVLKAHSDAAGQLASHLGLDRNLMLFKEYLHSKSDLLPKRLAEKLMTKIELHSNSLRDVAYRLGQRVFAERSSALQSRMDAYLTACKTDYLEELPG